MISKQITDIIKILDNVTKVLNEQPEKELKELLKVLQQSLKSVTHVLNKLHHVQIIKKSKDIGDDVQEIKRKNNVFC